MYVLTRKKGASEEIFQVRDKDTREIVAIVGKMCDMEKIGLVIGPVKPEDKDRWGLVNKDCELTGLYATRKNALMANGYGGY